MQSLLCPPICLSSPSSYIGSNPTYILYLMSECFFKIKAFHKENIKRAVLTYLSLIKSVWILTFSLLFCQHISFTQVRCFVKELQVQTLHKKNVICYKPVLTLKIHIWLKMLHLTCPAEVRARDDWLPAHTFLMMNPCRASMTLGRYTRLVSPWPSLPARVSHIRVLALVQTSSRHFWWDRQHIWYCTFG